MSALTLRQLVEDFGGVAFSLGLDRPHAGAIRRLHADDPALAASPLDVQIASSAVRPRDLFAALPGLRADGWSYARDAFARGASAVLAPAHRSLSGLRARALSSPLPGSSRGVVWLHPRARRVAGEVAARLQGDPSATLGVAAVTGTNGKTSVCHITHHLLRESGIESGLFGTAGNVIASARGPLHLGASHTTADAPALQRLLRRHLGGGGRAIVMEASSHALLQERLVGTRLLAAGFTNLTRDHLDYHGTMEAYIAAKALLWDHVVPGGTAVIFGDSAPSRHMCAVAAERGLAVVRAAIEVDGSCANVLAGSSSGAAQQFLLARNVVRDVRGITFDLVGMGIAPGRITLPLFGLHNLENALVAAGLARALGATSEAIHTGLASTVAPPGRLEAVAVRDGSFEVLVDYAHTPDALERVLTALREELRVRGDRGRLLCVFGCGGDRDAGKRGPMGEAAGRLADVTFVTSDNPRSEDPGAIVAAVVRGVDAVGGRRIVEPDRRRAIERSFGCARPGDIVLIAGKGHENVQIGARGAEPFDDRVVAAELLAELEFGAGSADEPVREIPRPDALPAEVPR